MSSVGLSPSVVVVGPGDLSRLGEYSIDYSTPLGQGKYARVYRATRIRDGVPVALKELRIFEMDGEARRECLKETQSLKFLSHPNIIQCYDAFIEQNELYLVLEYAESGDLSKVLGDLKSRGLRFSEGDLWRIIFFLSVGLHHMHSNRVIHRDIKPQNIYLLKTAEVKIGDLGLSRIFSAHSQSAAAASLVGTPFYMSPELISGAPYTYSSDIWSLGILIYESSQLRVPFSTSGKAGLFELGQKILAANFDPLDNLYSEELTGLIKSILVTDPAKRPTAAQIIEIARDSIIRIEREANGPAVETVNSLGNSRPSSAGVSGNPFEHYIDLGVIGRGKHSTVHKARHRATGEIVAIKRVAIFDMDSAARRECINESQILSKLPRHAHIIRYIDSGIYANDLYLVLELAESGDIGRLIESARKAESPLEEREIWFYFTQICQALQVMHSGRIMHRDIKPSNCFLANEKTVKLGDLGLGRYLSSKTLETFSMVGCLEENEEIRLFDGKSIMVKDLGGKQEEIAQTSQDAVTARIESDDFPLLMSEFGYPQRLERVYRGTSSVLYQVWSSRRLVNSPVSPVVAVPSSPVPPPCEDAEFCYLVTPHHELSLLFAGFSERIWAPAEAAKEFEARERKFQQQLRNVEIPQETTEERVGELEDFLSAPLCPLCSSHGLIDSIRGLCEFGCVKIRLAAPSLACLGLCGSAQPPASCSFEVSFVSRSHLRLACHLFPSFSSFVSSLSSFFSNFSLLPLGSLVKLQAEHFANLDEIVRNSFTNYQIQGQTENTGESIENPLEPVDFSPCWRFSADLESFTTGRSDHCWHFQENRWNLKGAANSERSIILLIPAEEYAGFSDAVISLSSDFQSFIVSTPFAFSFKIPAAAAKRFSIMEIPQGSEAKIFLKSFSECTAAAIFLLGSAESLFRSLASEAAALLENTEKMMESEDNHRILASSIHSTNTAGLRILRFAAVTFLSWPSEFSADFLACQTISNLLNFPPLVDSPRPSKAAALRPRVFLRPVVRLDGSPFRWVGLRLADSRHLAVLANGVATGNTPFYMSPESISSTGYSFASDVWGLGALLYELAMLKNPFYSPNLNYYTLGNRIKRCEYEPLDTKFSPTLRGLVASVLTANPDDRPTVHLVSRVSLYASEEFDHHRIPSWDFSTIQSMIVSDREVEIGNSSAPAAAAAAAAYSQTNFMAD